MYTEDWVVKKPGGEEWGSIRNLIIDPNSRQLSYADVAVIQTNQVVRLPWTDIEVTHEGIFLKRTHMPLLNTAPCPSIPTSLDILAVPIRVPGKIGQRRQCLSSPVVP
ncbi:MAG TPA: hypothetical protein VJV04_08335 [Nitrospiraceae bacterium]|nr:hypothetical protein [Nitrospiraceae bacterium]